MSIEGEAWELLSSWLPVNGDPQRPRMQLATVTGQGVPDVRTVLLSEFSPEGFWFHTDSRSRKVADLAASPQVALLLLWPDFSRQLSVQGVASLASADEIAAAFAARTPFLQQVAWQNTDDLARLPDDERRARWAAHVATDEPPVTWTGYLVRPTRLTFWRTHEGTASRRTEFTRSSSGWSRQYLAG
ncbi:pyridoxamine 5'-phosphate oxidase family protein [Kineosporia sp. NBRC 101731]|uniref:pyridoxamine 5'-phosphate oxidase family protein n=1 Tax=Kineosporia sp. NBRC 101731 TaxID=3032199 RepID=UPI0024A232E5|nr:pyridoxamine 5'-phosphate oxidase family protein [Kineosporia sp. NBRC 101731]GLY29310.1 pyridoxine/pyridoxamine 5'-phosphate oxidase [Kineosporia sp. NBRC 101731]